MALVKWNGPQIVKALIKSAEHAVVKINSDTVMDAKKNAPRGVTGNLRRSIGMSKVENNDGRIGSWVGFAGGEDNVFRYAMAVEEGRAPGTMPPSQELILWVQRIIKPQLSRKGNSAKARGRLARIARSRGLAAQASDFGGKSVSQLAKAIGDQRLANLIKGLAFVIARAIKRRGIKARPFLVPVFKYYAAGLGDEFKAYFEQLTSTELPLAGAR